MGLYPAGAGVGISPPGRHPVGIYKAICQPGPRCPGWAFTLGRSLRRLRWQAVAHRLTPVPSLHDPHHRGSTAPAEDRAISGKGKFAACGGKGAPVRGPFGGPRPTRPLRPAGRHPAHPGRRRGAARPACCRSRGHVAAKAAPSARPGQVGRQPLRGGTPPQCKAKPLRGGPLARPCIAPPPRRLRRRCSGAARPPQVGAVGPSAPPARSAALRPPPRLRHACGAGSALGGLPAHSPPGVAARRPSLPAAAKPGRRLRPAALPLRGAAISTPRAGAAQVRPFRALRAAVAQGDAACGRDGHACERRSRVKCTALCAALDRRSPSRQRGIRRRGPLGPVTDPPPTERSAL